MVEKYPDDIASFIKQHAQHDVTALALQKFPDDWPKQEILNQIKTRQKAAHKFPDWRKDNAIVFPENELVEQASSSACATYKASLVSGDSFADLTAGMGVDSLAFSRRFKSGVAVEIDPRSADILSYNIGVFAASNLAVQNSAAEDFMESDNRFDLIYIDPQRRDSGHKGKFRFEACSPNVIDLLPKLFEKANIIMIKTSPMLDISEGLRELKSVASVHVVEWRGQVREVLYLLRKDAHNPAICPAQIDDTGAPVHHFQFTLDAEANAATQTSMPQTFLYDPCPAVLKSGAFKSLSAQFDLPKLEASTHLYTSDKNVDGFPGRTLKILGILPADKKALKGMKATLALRNFPGDLASIYKKYGLKEGADALLYACRTVEGLKFIHIETKS